MSDAVKSAQEFLARKGYPFEMKVASLFQKAEIGAYQSVYYTDSSTKSSREMDIVAISIKNIRNKNFNIVFVVECKYAESPWILFSSNSQGFSTQYLYSRGAALWAKHLANQPDFAHFFECNRNFGYGLTAIYKKDETKENAYIALQSILGFLKAEIANPRFAQSQDCVLYVPIIAIKGKLVKASLAKDGTVECSEIDEAQLIYKENIQGVNPKIHIVTENILEAYVKRLADDCQRVVLFPFLTETIVDPPFQSAVSVVNRAPKITP